MSDETPPWYEKSKPHSDWMGAIALLALGLAIPVRTEVYHLRAPVPRRVATLLGTVASFATCSSRWRSTFLEYCCGREPTSPCAIAWKAQQRLHARYARLTARGKNGKKTITAMARELAGF